MRAGWEMASEALVYTSTEVACDAALGEVLVVVGGEGVKGGWHG
jgi:hypothetical protein